MLLSSIYFVRLLTPLAALLAVQALAWADANQGAPALALNTGKQIYEAGCVACHGPDGKGTPQSTAGFKKPDSFPDFTRCNQTTAEMDNDYRAVITNGGPFRGFSQIMPSFRDALTADQINKVIGYIRGFCENPHWPRAELNLPRALITEKAYPEDETVLTTTLNAQGAPAVGNEIVEENRFGVKNEIEIAVPVDFQHQNRTWYGGFGDSSIGWKREIFSSLKSGSIFSVQGEAIFPTGSRAHGLGSGVTTFGTFVAFDQLFPHYIFVQFQGGANLPVNTAIAPRSAYWYTALGQSFSQNRGLGRTWSPMVEFLADRSFRTGAGTNWDVVPQFQVTVSARQHIKAAAGVYIPVTNTAGRPIQVMFYVLWDWQDGKLTEGW